MNHAQNRLHPHRYTTSHVMWEDYACLSSCLAKVLLHIRPTNVHTHINTSSRCWTHHFGDMRRCSSRIRFCCVCGFFCVRSVRDDLFFVGVVNRTKTSTSWGQKPPTVGYMVRSCWSPTPCWMWETKAYTIIAYSNGKMFFLSGRDACFVVCLSLRNHHNAEFIQYTDQWFCVVSRQNNNVHS